LKLEKKYAIALTAALGLFMAVLDNTVVNVALTPMAASFGAGLHQIQWVVTGYFLAQAAVIPMAGYISNRYGIRRMFILCITLFTIASLLCGLAQDETMLIIFRVLQGLGGGMLFPLSQSIAFGAFEPRERAAASSLVGVPVLLAPAFGPTVGGLLTDSLGWEAIFFVNVPVGIISVLLALWIIPADEPQAANKETRRPFDVVGLVLSLVGVVAVVYAFALVSETRAGSETALNPRGEINGWGYWPVWALLIGGVATLVAFAWYELRHPDPVLDLRLFRERNFTVSSSITWVSAAVVFGSLFLIPIFLEQVRLPHLSAAEAGLTLMPQGLTAAASIILAGRLYDKIGVRWLAGLGAVALVVSSWGLSNLNPASDGWSMMPWIILRGFGFGFSGIPVQTLALQAITGRALPKASSLFTASRQIASSIGIAIITTLFVQQTASHAQSIISSGSVTDPAQIAVQAGTSGINDVFLFVTVSTALILLLIWFLPSQAAQSAAAAARNRSTDASHAPAVLAD